MSDEGFSHIDIYRDDGRLRQRALNKDVRQARLEQRAAAPLARQLTAWHFRCASLAAKLDYSLSRGHPVGDLRRQIEELSADVATRFEEWRLSLGNQRSTGHIDDTERSCRSLVMTLNAMQRRCSSSELH